MQSPPLLRLRGSEIFPARHVPIAVFRLPAVGALRHDHDFHELFLVTNGSGKHELFTPQGDLHEAGPLAKGDLLSIPMGWSHSYAADHLEIFNVLFGTSLLERGAPTLERFRIFDRSLQAPTRWALSRGEFENLESQLQSIARELLGRKHGYEVAAPSKLLDALVWIERLDWQRSEPRRPESERAALQAIAFMEQRLSQTISVEDVAQAAHLSVNYFSGIFKEAIGTSPGRYLTRLRLEHARYLLLSTSLSVGQVALDSGFADPSHFARAFKAGYGVAPSRFRKTGESS